MTVALCAAAIVPAQAEARPAVEILKPKRGAVFVAPNARHALKVRVRAAPRVKRVRVFVSAKGKNRNVTKRFQRRRKGMLVATLRPGRDLPNGPAAIRVRGRRGGRLVATSAHLWVASRRADLIRVRGLPRRSPARPLNVRMRTPRRVADVRVRVNGVNARREFTRTLGGSWRGTLSASAGLRYGRNRISITAYTLGGRYERITRIVRVRRGRPLAGAGRDLVVRHRSVVRLDGTDTRPRKGERLRYTWRIVRRPKGSKARLRNRHAVRPRLRADRPGRYRLRLTVRSLSARGKASAAAAQGSDGVTVSAQPVVSPMGQPVQTITSDSHSGLGIAVGDAWYPMPPSEQGGQGAIQMVVLDGATAELVSNKSFAGSDLGVDYLFDELEEVGDSSIVMLAQPPNVPLQLSQSGANTLEQVWSVLGFEWSSSWRVSGGEPGYLQWPRGWSVVGVPQSGALSGLMGVSQKPGAPAGAMNGWLRETAPTAQGESGSGYIFNYGAEYITYDTSSGGDGVTQNQMHINGQTYTSGSFTSGSAFHVVWLDGGTLETLGQATIEGNDPGQLAATLASIDEAGPAVVFLTTIGTPNIPMPRDATRDGADPGWAAAANRIAAWGGNAGAFLSLDGSANAQYSFAGATEIGMENPNAGDDVSRKLEPDVPKARVIGLLERRPAGAYAPSTGDAPTGTIVAAAVQPALNQVLAQAPQPFPALDDSPASEAAEDYIAETLGIANDPTYGIRINYWDPRLDAQWTNLEASISNENIVPPCTDEPCKDGFAAVQAQLEREFEMVARVRTYFGSFSEGTLYGDVNQVFISNAFGFDQINDYIISKYPPQEATASGPNPLDIIEGFFDLSSEIVAEAVPEGGEAYAVGLAVAGAAIEIGNGFTEGESTGHYAGATVFEADASQFASLLAEGYTSSLGGLNRVADLLVSDWGRLQAASAGVLDEWAADPQLLSGALQRSMSAYMWGALLPASFQTYQCVVPPVYFPPEDFRPHPWYEHDIEAPSAVQWEVATVTNWPARTPGGWGPSGDPVPQANKWGFWTLGGEIAGDFTYIDAGVAGDLFGQVDLNDASKLGLLPSYFLAPQPYQGGPGFPVQTGQYDDSDSDQNGYVRYFCANNEWREDTNVNGQ